MRGSLPFPFSVCSKQTENAVSVSSFCVCVFIYIYIYIYTYIYIYIYSIFISYYFKQIIESGSPAIFLNPFTVCSSCKWKFFVGPFVDKETNGIYSFANGLNTLNGLVDLCRYIIEDRIL